METLQYQYAELRAIPANVDETRTVEFVISDETKDRHGARLMIDRWNLKNYKRNPIVGYQHNLYGDMCTPPNPDDIIGKSNVYIEDGKLIGAVTFETEEMNPLAEKIFQKVKFGTLNMASVGFIGKGQHYGDGDERNGGAKQTEYFDEQELLEWSIVNIPSNPNASKREFTIQSERALRYVSNLIGNRLSIEEIKKMTVNGLIRLVNGESLEDDQKEKNAELKLSADNIEKAKQELRNKELENEINTLSEIMSRTVSKYNKKEDK